MDPNEVYQPAFVIHSRPYRETSLLVDFFTANFGRIAGVVRGARRSHKRRLIIQPYTPLQITWSGRSELKTIRSIEMTTSNLSVTGGSLYSAMYLNELLYRLLRSEEPVPELFASYMNCLETVAADYALQEQERALRRFELEMFGVLGYGVSFSLDADSGSTIQSDRAYQYRLGQGFCRVDDQSSVDGVVSGYLLQTISSDSWTRESLHYLKKINRQIIEHLLDGKPLNSRQLFIQSKMHKPMSSK